MVRWKASLSLRLTGTARESDLLCTRRRPNYKQTVHDASDFLNRQQTADLCVAALGSEAAKIATVQDCEDLFFMRI